MRTKFLPNIIVSSLLCFGLTAAAAAQGPRGSYDSRYGAYSATDFHDNQILFAHVRSDLDRAENNIAPFSDSRNRLDRVRGELSELQRQWDENTYDPSQVDTVIQTLERVMRTGDLLPRDRDRLGMDLDNLRQFRDNHE
jgi:TolA-binding protein